MIIHSGKYENGDRLSLEHEKFVLEKLLAYHPECEKKIGCGIDYITVTPACCWIGLSCSSLLDIILTLKAHDVYS
ncbi:unnamed protein product, partial [Vitis vinifera]